MIAIHPKKVQSVLLYIYLLQFSTQKQKILKKWAVNSFFLSSSYCGTWHLNVSFKPSCLIIYNKYLFVNIYCQVCRVASYVTSYANSTVYKDSALSIIRQFISKMPTQKIGNFQNGFALLNTSW